MVAGEQETLDEVRERERRSQMARDRAQDMSTKAVQTSASIQFEPFASGFAVLRADQVTFGIPLPSTHRIGIAETSIDHKRHII